jgi:hypothetical protein
VSDEYQSVQRFIDEEPPEGVDLPFLSRRVLPLRVRIIRWVTTLISRLTRDHSQGPSS